MIVLVSLSNQSPKMESIGWLFRVGRSEDVTINELVSVLNASFGSSLIVSWQAMSRDSLPKGNSALSKK